MVVCIIVFWSYTCCVLRKKILEGERELWPKPIVVVLLIYIFLSGKRITAPCNNSQSVLTS